MKDYSSKEITLDILQSLENLVKEFGDSKNTARVLDISHTTFVGYLNGSKKVISWKVWQYKIEPYLQKNKIEILNFFSKELNRLRKLEKETFEMKYEIKSLEDKIKDLENENEDKIHKLLYSPFPVYFSEFVNSNTFYTFPLLDDLKKISNKEDISLLSFSVHMNEFKRLYELFRPRSISQDHPYWGTATKIDNIFQTISRIFGEELDYNFSKFGQTYIESLNRKKSINYDVDWKSLYEDTVAISESINMAIIILAIDSKIYFENRYTHRYSKFILAYIENTYPDFNLLEITNSKIEPGKIIMKDKLIEFNNTYQLDNQIYKLV